MLKFLFTKDFSVDPDSATKIADEQSKKVLQVSLDRLSKLVLDIYASQADELKNWSPNELAAGLEKGAINFLPINWKDWNHVKIEEVLRKALVEELGLKPRIAFGAVRIAVTGSHISPPLFESMELLGAHKSLERIKAAL